MYVRNTAGMSNSFMQGNVQVLAQKEKDRETVTPTPTVTISFILFFFYSFISYVI